MKCCETSAACPVQRMKYATRREIFRVVFAFRLEGSEEQQQQQELAERLVVPLVHERIQDAGLLLQENISGNMTRRRTFFFSFRSLAGSVSS